ncbi:MAG: CoA transferase [Burkholderiales bacterium]|nr:CoA transferase [Bacteroidia bacterium]
MYQPFSDINVIELAGVLAGPSAGLFFSELGARVIKIENPKTDGDVTRSWKLYTENPNDKESAYYWSINAGKEVQFLDLTVEQDLQQFYNLIKTADVVISNYKCGDDIKLKVDFNTLKSIKPDLIYASINGFGKTNSRTAYDLILQAESGFMFMNGEKNAAPLKMPVALIDILAGHQLKEAILIALLKKYKTQEGSNISVPLFDTAVASLANQATNWLVAHHLPISQGSQHPNIAPYGEIFTSKDGHQFTLAIGNNKQFKALCDILGLQLYALSNYQDNQQRVSHRENLFIELENVIKHLNFENLFKECLKKDIPIGKIRNLKEVFQLPEAQELINTFTFGDKTIHTVKSTSFVFEN